MDNFCHRLPLLPADGTLMNAVQTDLDELRSHRSPQADFQDLKHKEPEKIFYLRLSVKSASNKILCFFLYHRFYCRAAFACKQLAWFAVALARAHLRDSELIERHVLKLF